MKNVALITGASSGLGVEFARIHAENTGDCIITARSKDKLEELKVELEKAFSRTVIVIVADLSTAEGIDHLIEQIDTSKIEIDYLINNAGFGDYGEFSECKIEKQQQMIQLNITSLTKLTHFCLQGMKLRNKGKILNLASIASFLPGPLFSIYSATKAYVHSFSVAISEECKDYNVSVTCLCPGPTETGFVKNANVDGVGVFKFMPKAITVAEKGYNAMNAGKVELLDRFHFAAFIKAILPFIPLKIYLKTYKFLMQKRTDC